MKGSACFREPVPNLGWKGPLQVGWLSRCTEQGLIRLLRALFSRVLNIFKDGTPAASVPVLGLALSQGRLLGG